MKVNWRTVRLALVLLAAVFGLCSSSVLFRRPRSFLNEWDRVHALGPWIEASKGEPWPKPQEMTTSSDILNLHPKYFKFRVSNFSCDILRKALKRYKPLVLYGKKKRNVSSVQQAARLEAPPVQPLLRSLRIVLREPCEQMPYFEMDESYTLDVGFESKLGAILTSSSIWGVLRGLETFTHLVFENDDGKVIKKTLIEDFPRFPHRGILLDTSRHYLPVSTIKKNLDLMAMNKFNTFHWHIVDDNSFPYESSKFPNLSKFGSYAKSLVYSQKNIKDIIEYARFRGIRVMTEFDTPGHTQSWGPGQPDLLTQCYDDYGIEISEKFGPVNLAKEINYEFMRELFQEIITVFPEKFVHLGGDEVSHDCWLNNPEVRDFMTHNGLLNGNHLQEFYINKLMKVVQELNKNNTFVVWQEMFDNTKSLDPDTIVHVWKGGAFRYEMSQLTSSGMKAILSSCWYLNYVKYGIDWHKLYTCEPTDGVASHRTHLVLGGEAAMWGEYVDDTNLIPRLWPRASAVAERLWSDQLVTSTTEAAPRMEEHRCRLRRRGYRVQPATGSGYCPP